MINSKFKDELAKNLFHNLFKNIDSSKKNIKLSIFEIYNRKIIDWLRKENSILKTKPYMRHVPEKNHKEKRRLNYIDNLTMIKIKDDEKQCIELLNEALE